MKPRDMAAIMRILDATVPISISYAANIGAVAMETNIAAIAASC